MEYNYLIVLFKNKVKKKIINKFQTLQKTELTFKKLTETSNKVIFEKKMENGIPCQYELALVERYSGHSSNVYIKDDIGRQRKVELVDNDYRILKIVPFSVPDKILDVKTGKRITSETFIKKYLPEKQLSMVSSLNNKIIVQHDDDYKLFTLKTNSDAQRLIDSLFNYFMENKRTDSIFVKDVSTVQRKYLYNILEEKGFSKSYLQRHSTTHPSKK
jgi:hypothetical protein